MAGENRLAPEVCFCTTKLRRLEHKHHNIAEALFGTTTTSNIVEGRSEFFYAKRTIKLKAKASLGSRTTHNAKLEELDMKKQCEIEVLKQYDKPRKKL
jgi:hypothetical protein